MFGKPAASTVKTVRMHSFSVQWSGSDSSIDSIPSSSDEIEEHEYDWPEQTGFQVHTRPSMVYHASQSILSVNQVEFNKH